MRTTDQQQELLDSIVEEFTSRLRHGERPAVSEFSDRHPALQSEIEELLTSVAMIEELKTQSSSSSNSLKKEMKEILRLSRIGDYKIIRELGRGGMGIVFEAVHESLGRRVAIKVMPNRSFDDEKYLERFSREAQAAANLHHTNIVSVFGMGQTGEHRYYVMEFVDGKSLSEVLARINGMNEANTQHGNNTETRPHDVMMMRERLNKKAMPPVKEVRTQFDSSKERFRWAAKMGMQIADGLAYAHGQGTLHRDIKPSNLLVDRNETVWLTDFGLVKHIDNQSITKTGDIIGTPQYMAPESFDGRYDKRSETYCLGLTLYEMVTLKPAFVNASTPELIHRITTTLPPAPRKVDPRIPRDLNQIIQKAVSRERSYRYESAEQMRDDLRAFLEDRPISARNISMTENIFRWSRRNPLAASLALATGLMICTVAVTSTIFLSISNQQLKTSEQQATSLDVEKRVVQFARDEANKHLELANANLEFAVELYDDMFRWVVLKDENPSNDITLDGFNQLRGVSTTVSETDAEYLGQMLKCYMEFAEKNKEDVKLRTLTAKSFRRVANIYHLTGEQEDAIDAYKKSIEIYEELQSNAVQDIPLVIEFANTLNEKGQAVELAGTPKSRSMAMAEYRKAEDVLNEHPDTKDIRVQLELAKTKALIGAPHYWKKPELPKRFYDVISEQQKHCPFAVLSTKQKAKNPVRVTNASESRIALNESLTIVNDLLEAIESSDYASNDATPVGGEANGHSTEIEVSDVELKLLKATVLSRLAGLQLAAPVKNSSDKQKLRNLEMKNRKLSRRYLQEAIGLISGLRNEQPGSPEFQFVEALILATPARFTAFDKIESLKKSKNLLKTLASNHNRNLEYKSLLANVSFRLARAYVEKRELKSAEMNMRFANGIYEEIMRETPRSRQIQLPGAACVMQLADLQLRQGKTKQAIDVLENSLATMNEVRKANKRMPRAFYVMKANRLIALSIIHEEAGNKKEAKSARSRADAALPKPTPSNTQPIAIR